MSSIERPLSGDVVIVELSGGGEGPPPGGRRARTLIKNGLIRATLVTVAAGAEIPEHRARPGPITVQPLQGRLQFSAAGNTHEIGPGQLLSLGAGVRHAVASASGATFLLTVASVGASGDPPKPS